MEFSSSNSTEWVSKLRIGVSSNNPDDIEKAVSEIKDRMDVLTADFSLFVSNLYQSLSSILQSVIPVQSQDNQLNKIRLDVIEIFHRFPTSSELLRPIAIDLMNVLLKVLNDDNEGNAIVAAKIFFDLHKTYRSNLETYVQPLLDIAIRTYKNITYVAKQPLPLQSHATANPAPMLTLPTNTQAQCQDPNVTSGSTAVLNEQSNVRMNPDLSDVTNRSPCQSVATNSDSLVFSSQSILLKEEPSSADVSQTQTQTNQSKSVQDSNIQMPAMPHLDGQVAESICQPQAQTPTLNISSTQIQAEVPSDAQLPSSPPSRTPLSPSARLGLSLQFKQSYKAPLVPATQSIKFQAELPPILLFFHQCYPKSTQKYFTTLIQLIVNTVDIPPTSVVKERYRDLVCAQVKSFNFISFAVRTHYDYMRQFEQPVIRSLHQLFFRCPDDAQSLRKELILSFKYIVSTDMKKSMFAYVNDIIDEQFMLGPNCPKNAYLRPTAYATIIEFLFQVKDSLNINQLIRVIHIFSLVVHDPTLNISIQLASLRLLLQLIDIISIFKTELVDTSYYLLLHIWQTFVGKLNTLLAIDSETSTERKAGGGNDPFHTNSLALFQDLFENQVAKLRGSSAQQPVGQCSGFPTATATQFDLNTFLKGMSDVTLVPFDLSADFVEAVMKENRPLNKNNISKGLFLTDYNVQPYSQKESKSLVRTIVIGFKQLLQAMQNLKYFVKRVALEQQSKFDPSLNLLFTRDSDRYMLLKTFYLGYSACSEFYSLEGDDSKSTLDSTQELQEILEHFTGNFSLLDINIVKPLVAELLPKLFDLCLGKPQCFVIIHRMITIEGHASQLIDVIYSFLFTKLPLLSKVAVPFSNDFDTSYHAHRNASIDRMRQKRPKEISSIKDSDEKVCSLILKLYKSIIAFPKSNDNSNNNNEKMLRIRIVPLIIACLQYAYESSIASNYYGLIRFAFRIIFSNKYEQCYHIIGTAIPVFLAGLTQLHQQTVNEYSKACIVEIAIIIPARWITVIPHLQLILPFIALALKSKTDLPYTAFRSLEYWLESSNLIDFSNLLESDCKTLHDIWSGLCEHLKPQPYPYGTQALKLIGKLGGHCQNWIRGYSPQSVSTTESQQLKYVDMGIFSPTSAQLVVERELSAQVEGQAAVGSNKISVTTGVSVPQQSLCTCTCDIIMTIRECLKSVCDLEILPLDIDQSICSIPVFIDEDAYCCPTAFTEFMNSTFPLATVGDKTRPASGDIFSMDSFPNVEIKQANVESHFIVNMSYKHMIMNAFESLCGLLSSVTRLNLEPLGYSLSQCPSILVTMLRATIIMCCFPTVAKSSQERVRLIINHLVTRLTVADSYLFQVMSRVVMLAFNDYIPHVVSQGVWFITEWFNACRSVSSNFYNMAIETLLEELEKSVNGSDSLRPYAYLKACYEIAKECNSSGYILSSQQNVRIILLIIDCAMISPHVSSLFNLEASFYKVLSAYVSTLVDSLAADDKTESDTFVPFEMFKADHMQSALAQISAGLFSCSRIVRQLCEQTLQALSQRFGVNVNEMISNNRFDLNLILYGPHEAPVGENSSSLIDIGRLAGIAYCLKLSTPFLQINSDLCHQLTWSLAIIEKDVDTYEQMCSTTSEYQILQDYCKSYSSCDALPRWYLFPFDVQLHNERLTVWLDFVYSFLNNFMCSVAGSISTLIEDPELLFTRFIRLFSLISNRCTYRFLSDKITLTFQCLFNFSRYLSSIDPTQSFFGHAGGIQDQIITFYNKFQDFRQLSPLLCEIIIVIQKNERLFNYHSILEKVFDLLKSFSDADFFTNSASSAVGCETNIISSLLGIVANTSDNSFPLASINTGAGLDSNNEFLMKLFADLLTYSRRYDFSRYMFRGQPYNMFQFSSSIAEFMLDNLQICLSFIFAPNQICRYENLATMKTLCLAANDSSRRLVDALALPSTITFIIDTLLTPGFPYTDDGLATIAKPPQKPLNLFANINAENSPSNTFVGLTFPAKQAITDEISTESSSQFEPSNVAYSVSTVPFVTNDTNDTIFKSQQLSFSSQTSTDSLGPRVSNLTLMGYSDEDIKGAVCNAWRYLKALVRRRPEIMMKSDDLLSCLRRHFSSTYGFCANTMNNISLISFPSIHIVMQHKKLKTLTELLLLIPASHDQHCDTLFELIYVFTVQCSLTDFTFVINHIREYIASLHLDKKKSMLFRSFQYFTESDITSDYKVKLAHHIIIPILYNVFSLSHSCKDQFFDSSTSKMLYAELIECFQFSSHNNSSSSLTLPITTGILRIPSGIHLTLSDDTSKLNEKLGNPGEETEMSQDTLGNPTAIDSIATTSSLIPDSVKICKLKILTLIFLHVGDRFIDKGNGERREQKLLEFCCNHYFKLDESMLKNWGCLCLCSFFTLIESPPKLVMNVYVSLLKANSSEGREIVKGAIDVLLPILQSRLTTSNEKYSFAKVWTWTKKFINEENHNVSNVMHIFQIILKHPDVFYSFKSHLATLMLSYIIRIGLSPNSTIEHRMLALNILDVIIGWEAYRLKRIFLRKIEHITDDSITVGFRRMAVDAEIHLNDGTPATLIGLPNQVSGRKRNISAIKMANVTGEALINFDKDMVLQQGHVQLMGNFIIRFNLFVVEAKDSQVSKLLPRITELYKKFVEVFPFGSGVKLSYLEKYLTPIIAKPSTLNPNNQNQTSAQSISASTASLPVSSNANSQNISPPAENTSMEPSSKLTSTEPVPDNSVLTLLEILLSSFKSFKSSRLLLVQCFPHAVALIPIAFNTDNSKILSLFRQFCKSLAEIYPPSSSCVHPPELQKSGFYLILKQAIDYNLKIPETSNGILTQTGAAEMKWLVFSVNLINDLSEISPSWIEHFATNLYKVIQSLIGDHISRASKFNSKVADLAISITHSAELGADCSTVPSQLSASSNILAEFASPFHSYNFSRSLSSIHIRSFSSSDQDRIPYMSLLIQLVASLCKGLHQDQLKFLKEKIIAMLCLLIDSSDSPILLSVVSQIALAWILNKNSPLLDDEQYVLYVKLSSQGDRDLRDKSLTVENMALTFGLNCSLVCDRFGSYFEKSRQNFNDRFGSSVRISKHNPIGILSLMSPLPDLQFRTLLRVCRTMGRTSFDRLIRFFEYDWSSISNRYIVMLLPALLLLGIHDQHTNISGATINDLSNAQKVNVNITQITLMNPKFAEDVVTALVIHMWQIISNQQRVQLVASVQDWILRIRPKKFIHCPSYLVGKPSVQNIPQFFIKLLLKLEKEFFFSIDFLGAIGSTYYTIYEMIEILENILFVKSSLTLHSPYDSSMRRLYDVYVHLLIENNEADRVVGVSRMKNAHIFSLLALSNEHYDMIDEAQKIYLDALGKTCSPDSTTCTLDFSPDDLELWESRWVETARELSQWSVLADFAKSENLLDLLLESTMMASEWNILHRMRTTPAAVANLERGSLQVKLADVMIAVTENRLNEVERNCAMTVQLALSQWSMLPPCSSSSKGHKLLLSSFHRVIELRESASVSHEILKSAKDKKVPDIKNLLRTWRVRIPEKTLGSTFLNFTLEWRLTLFNIIKNVFSSYDQQQTAAINDTTWTVLSLSQIARKRSFIDTSSSCLARLRNSTTMDIQSAYTKLREQILLTVGAPDNDVVGGINLINSTNLEYFSSQQKAELFRLKGLCLKRQGYLDLASEMLSQSVQISPNCSQAWLSWNHVCYATYSVKLANLSCSNSGNCDKNEHAELHLQAKLTIACATRAVDLDSIPGYMLMRRVLWIIESFPSHENNEGSADLISSLIQLGQNIPTWKWLHLFADITKSVYVKEYYPLLSKVARAHPQAVMFDFISVVDTSTNSNADCDKLANVCQSLILDLKNTSHGALLTSALEIIDSINRMTQLSPEGYLRCGFELIINAIVNAESLLFDQLLPESLNTALSSCVSVYINQCYVGLNSQLKLFRENFQDKFQQVYSVINQMTIGELFECCKQSIQTLNQLSPSALLNSTIARRYNVKLPLHGTFPSGQSVHLVCVEVPGQYCGIFPDSNTKNKALMTSFYMSPEWVLQSANIHDNTVQLQFQITVYDHQGGNSNFTLRRHVNLDFASSHSSSGASSLSSNILVQRWETDRLVDWALQQHMSSRRRDLYIGSIRPHIKLSRTAHLISNPRDSIDMSTRCFNSKWAASESIWAARVLLNEILSTGKDLTLSDIKAAKFKVFESMMSNTRCDKMIASMNPPMTHSSESFINKKLFAIQLGLQAALTVVTNGTAVSASDFFTSTNGHVYSQSMPVYSKGFLIKLLQPIYENRRSAATSTPELIRLLQSSDLEKRIGGRITMTATNSSANQMLDSVMRISPSILEYLSAPLLMGYTLQSFASAVDAVSLNLDIFEAELCMHHYVDFLELIDQHVVGKNAEKVENNKPEDSDAMQIGHNEDMTVNDNVLNNCAIKKAVIDVSADECSRKRRKEIIILAQNLAREKVRFLRQSSPLLLSKRASTSRHMVESAQHEQVTSQSPTEYWLCDWDQPYYFNSIISPSYVEDHKNIKSAVNFDAYATDPVDVVFLRFIQRALDHKTVAENQPLGWMPWL